MAKILKDSWVEEEVIFEHVFDDIHCAGAGFWFTCNEKGVVDTRGMSEAGLENYKKCLSGVGVIDKGIQRRINSYRHGRTIRCDCGKTFEIEYDEQECENCHQLYSLFGGKLARRMSECRMMGDY